MIFAPKLSLSVLFPEESGKSFDEFINDVGKDEAIQFCLKFLSRKESSTTLQQFNAFLNDTWFSTENKRHTLKDALPD